MRKLLVLARWIDRLSECLGWVTLGLTLVMVAIGTYNALTRYLGRYLGVNLSSNVYLEMQWYLFSLIFLFGMAYVLKRNGHVRVDIIYSHLSPRGKAWVDLLGAVLLLLPFCTVVLVYSVPAVLNSWQVLERSSDPSGLPRYPLKTVILIAFGLLALQGIAEAIRQVARLRKDWPDGTSSASSSQD